MIIRGALRLFGVVGRRSKALICLVAATSMINSISDALQPFFLGAAAVSLVSNSSAAFRIIATYIALGLLSALMSAVSNYAILRAREWISFDMARATLSAVLSDEGEMSSSSVGNLVHAYTKGREAANTLVADLLASVLPYIVALSLSIYLVASRLSGISATILVVFTAVYVALNLKGVGKEMRSARNLATEQKNLFGTITMAHELREVIRAFGTRTAVENRLTRSAETMDRHVRAHGNLFFRKHITLDLIRWVGLAALIGAFFIEPDSSISNAQSRNVGALVTLVFAYFQMMAPIVALSRAGERLAQAAAGLEAALPVLMHDRSADNTWVGARGEARHVQLKNIRAGYGDRQIADPLSASWKPGDVIIFFGPSGIGKSTLAKTIAGLIPAFSGQVTIDDRVFTLPNDTEELRRVTLYAPQADFVFGASVFDNIALYDPSISHEEVLKATFALGIDPVLRTRGLSIYDELSDRGADWSGGERRRLALARAYVRSSSILILDEPTTGLDSLSAQIVTKAFRAKMTDGILIIITHDQISEAGDVLLDFGSLGASSIHP